MEEAIRLSLEKLRDARLMTHRCHIIAAKERQLQPRRCDRSR